jgi:hypothetical protein
MQQSSLKIKVSLKTFKNLAVIFSFSLKYVEDQSQNKSKFKNIEEFGSYAQLFPEISSRI